MGLNIPILYEIYVSEIIFSNLPVIKVVFLIFGLTLKSCYGDGWGFYSRPRNVAENFHIGTFVLFDPQIVVCKTSNDS